MSKTQNTNRVFKGGAKLLILEQYCTFAKCILTLIILYLEFSSCKEPIKPNLAIY